MGVNTKELIENNRKVTVGRRSNMKMVENRKELRDNHSPKEILHSDRAKHSEGKYNNSHYEDFIKKA